jgi:phytoene/squalene synthetase
MAINTIDPTSSLAREITYKASQQTAWTIQTLVPQHKRDDAFRAYAYFRWVDDVLDGDSLHQGERLSFLHSQMELLDQCLSGNPPRQISSDEWLLVELTQGPLGHDPGLRTYLRDMMAVMAFDAHRRQQRISQFELALYSKRLAAAVTEAVYTFIGDRCGAPRTAARYLAADAAHIVHMLRDMHEDLEAGYINIPLEVLPGDHVRPEDLSLPQVKDWVRSRIETAHSYFRQGEAYLAQIGNSRCRMAGVLYALRFQGVMEAIEREDYQLCRDYSDCMSPMAAIRRLPDALRMFWKPRVSPAAVLNPPHYQTDYIQQQVDFLQPANNES